METTISKQILKTNYYWEFRGFYDDLPEDLPIPEKVTKKANDRLMTEQEMMKGRSFLPKLEAFGLAAKMAQNGETGLIFFEDEGVRCKVYVWHNDYGPNVRVHKFNPQLECLQGRVSYSR